MKDYHPNYRGPKRRVLQAIPGPSGKLDTFLLACGHTTVRRTVRAASVLPCEGCRGTPSGVKAQSLAVRFWSTVNKNGPCPPHRPELGQCWIWTGAFRGSYGQLTIGSKHHGTRRTEGAHRIAFFLQHGHWPVSALHHCDNPACVRAEHLFDGTQADNVHDAVSKGRLAHGDEHWTKRSSDRLARGLRHGQAKLSDEEVKAIRESREPARIVADRYGIHPNYVGSLRRNERRA